VGFSFENFDTCFLTSSVAGSVQKSADRLNRVTPLANDPGHIALSRGQMKDQPFSCLGLRKDNLVREFDELANDEEKELLHASKSG